MRCFNSSQGVGLGVGIYHGIPNEKWWHGIGGTRMPWYTMVLAFLEISTIGTNVLANLFQ